MATMQPNLTPVIELIVAQNMVDYARAIAWCIGSWRSPGTVSCLPVFDDGSGPRAEIADLFKFAGARLAPLPPQTPVFDPSSLETPALCRWIMSLEGTFSPPGALDPRRRGRQQIIALENDTFAIIGAAHARVTNSPLVLVPDMDALLVQSQGQSDVMLTLAIHPDRLTPGVLETLAWRFGTREGFGIITAGNEAAASRLIIKPFLLGRRLSGPARLLSMRTDLQEGKWWNGRLDVWSRRAMTADRLNALTRDFHPALLLHAHGQDLDMNLVAGALCAPWERLITEQHDPAPDLPVCAYGKGCRFPFEGLRIGSHRLRAGFVLQASCGGLCGAGGVYARKASVAFGLIDVWPAALVTSYRYTVDVPNTIMLFVRLLLSNLSLGQAVAETNRTYAGSVRETPLFLVVGDPTLCIGSGPPLARGYVIGVKGDALEVSLPPLRDGHAYVEVTGKAAALLDNGNRPLYAETSSPGGPGSGLWVRWSCGVQTGEPLRIHFFNNLPQRQGPAGIRINTRTPVSPDLRARIATGHQRAAWLGVMQVGLETSAGAIQGTLDGEVSSVARSLSGAGLRVDSPPHARVMARSLLGKLRHMELTAVEHLLHLSTTQPVWPANSYQLQNTRAWDDRFENREGSLSICPYCGQASHGYRASHALLPIVRDMGICIRCGIWHDTPAWGEPLVIHRPEQVPKGWQGTLRVTVRNPLERPLGGCLAMSLSLVKQHLAHFEPGPTRVDLAPKGSVTIKQKLRINPELPPGIFYLRVFAMLDMDLFFANTILPVVPA